MKVPNPIVVERISDTEWAMLSPLEIPSVNKGAIGSILAAFAELRTGYYPENIDDETAGLAGRRRFVRATLADGTVYTIVIGNEIDVGRQQRYARLGEDGIVFALLSHNAIALTQMPSAFEPSAGPPGGPPGGPPNGPPPKSGPHTPPPTGIYPPGSLPAH